MLRGKQTNPLRAYFESGPERLLHKWVHYFDIYHRHLAPYRGRQLTVVEFGVYHGGSLRMWRKYFGRRARIVGVDIDPRCAGLAERGTEVVIGDQEDREFLGRLRERLGPIDVVIDDGGHEMAQQIATFEEFWPAVRDGGLYIVEDLHTSYWEEFGGGWGLPGTFIEYAKGLVDEMHAWHTRERGHHPSDWTRSIAAMHVYESMIVLEKAAVPEPVVRKMGAPVFPDDAAAVP
jgi:hypothetical protein